METNQTPIAIAEVGAATACALALDFLHPDREPNAEEITRDGVALITALEAQRDARFVLQTTCVPDVVRPERGKLDVHLIAVVEHAEPDRRDELLDDLRDLLGAPPLRWSFSPVISDVELAHVLDPFPFAHFAEIARREEPCIPTSWEGSIGFTDEVSARQAAREIWSTWTLGPASSDPRRLAGVFLVQEAPICMRVLLTPTELAADEQSALERLQLEVGRQIPEEGLQRASLRTLEAFLYVRPLFQVSCVVASTERLSRSLLSAIGHSVSEPAKHGLPQPVLQGGFAVLRGDSKGRTSQPLGSVFGALAHATTPSAVATGPLTRLRRLMGPWEAANVFRIPVAHADGVPGFETLDIPALDPPVSRLPEHGTRIGSLVSHGRVPVLIDDEARLRHAYVSGQTGTGKSTLLLNMAVQDMHTGHGLAVLDPHGDLIEALLERIPDDRIDDVVLVDPADDQAVVGVNLLEADSPVQQEYLVEELARMFGALFDPRREGIVGPRFETMLRQAANLLMANDTPSSMLDIATVFTDDAVRAALTQDLTDPVLAEYWLGEMQMRRSNEWQEVISWFRSKFEVFRTSRLVRNVVGQARSSVSFSDVLRDQRILLVNLSKGLLGEYNSALIGYIVFARLWSAALERASVSLEERRPFQIYIDEFQNMTNESLPSVLSEARKFRVGLTLANQFFTQIPELTRDAIMGNVGSRVTFRLGPKDAALFSPWLGSPVHPDDLTTLPNHTAIVILSDDGIPLPPFALRTDPPPESAGESRSGAARSRSRSQWAREVDGLDEEFFGRWRQIPGSISSKAAAAVHRPHVTPAQPPRAGQASFLDSWLTKQQSARAPSDPSNPEPEGDQVE